MSKENKGATSIEVTLAFLLGGVVGAGLALLFAPASGAETRKKLRETGDVLHSKLHESTGEWKETVTGSLDKARESVKTFVDDKKVRTQAAYSAAKDAWQKPSETEGQS